MPSTVVAKMEYDPAASTLRITFVSGLIYVYKDIPESIYNAMRSSGAKGTYLNRYIKGQFEFEKVN